MADYGNRPDGAKKGTGWLGELKRPDGNISTEISASFDDVLGGKDIPLIVPTLSKEELSALLQANPDDDDFFQKIPPSIIQKAIEHAVFRAKDGKSPFNE